MYLKVRNVIQNKENLFMISIFIFFIFTMVFNLTHSALWGDEWVEYVYSQTSIRSGAMYQCIISTFQPPLYNFLMHFWLKIGKSVLWFRFFNIPLGCISGGFLFASLKKIYNRNVAGIALCLLAACYQWIFCIQECSEYALMLCCLFGSIFFYILSFEHFTYTRMNAFIMSAVLAIYSQYGAVFVALPLLLLYFIGNLLSQEAEKKQKICVTVSYVISFFAFAVPLYVFFLKHQMEANQLADHSIPLTADLLSDIPYISGNILGYLYNLNIGNVWPLIFSIVGIFLIVFSAVILIKGKIDWIRKSLILMFWIGYIANYFLVKMHIYAMVHAGQSYGFFSRYSYFYIPAMSIALPIIIVEFITLIDNEGSIGLYKYFMVVVCIFGVSLSMFSIVKNWNKSLDDRFAEIWMENAGWEDITYLYGGMSSYSFNYYISHSEGYKEGYLNNATTVVDNKNLPLKFWAWRTNWSNNGWKTTIDTATSLGYTVTVFYDLNYLQIASIDAANAAQLAYCSYDGEIDELTLDDMDLQISNAAFWEDGTLHIEVDFRDPSTTNIEYNINDYMLSYHVLDPEGQVVAWNNSRININRWVDYSSCEIVIDPSQIELDDYSIQIDVVQEGVEWVSDRGIECPSIVITNGIIKEW